jgi:mannose-6-phosphate isomerase
MHPVKLATKVLDKVWGSPLTEPWFRNPEGRNIGEIWFAASDSAPLLVKLLFTSDNLSIQVHPGDEYAHEHENGSRGKTEMWHILRAEPGAKIAVGLRETATREQVHAAALSGEIMDLMQWVEVQAGDTFFIPAGTIHAIGGGLALCEVQQVSDVTYRIYDFGRPRELHLEKGLEVSDLFPRDARALPKTLGPGQELLAECGYFRTERLSVTGMFALEPRDRNLLCIVLRGKGTLAGASFEPGEAWEIEAGSGPFAIESQDAAFLLTQVP